MGRGEGNEQESFDLASWPADPLSDLGMARPPIVDTPEGKKWNETRAERIRQADKQLRQLAMQLAMDLAKHETIPRGGYEDRPHSEYVENRFPDFYRGLVSRLGEDAKVKASYGTDKTGKEWRFVEYELNRGLWRVGAIDADSGLGYGDFTIADFDGGRKRIEQLWLELTDSFEVEKHAKPESQTGQWAARRSSTAA